MPTELRCEIRNQAAWLTIDRPQRRNALSPALIEELLRSLERFETDSNVRAVCLSGAGDKVFCAGADLAEALAGGADAAGAARRYAALLKRMVSLGRPLVARVGGHCLAGGIGLMLACDIVIAREDVYFQTPEVEVGLFPMMVGALLLRNVSRKKAAEMVLTARRVPAPEAEAMGLITRAVPSAVLDTEVEKIIARLVRMGPAALRIGKQAFHRADDMPFDEAVEHLCSTLGEVLATEDAAEGMAAFLQKRQPVFKGR